eukprot:TRINITY_DN56955_c0_g2_i1.p1 TRINITY_DN56955_c0_g2~~TRINITY_DN56955_c0_g2_i1.p1  ORF type:complete len:546 (+),score=87.31 TRINITY_DN56955_c0_g2_i1:230-1639(+)
MKEYLACVCTNTVMARNTGYAVLYECVRTITAIESDSQLGEMAINMMGNFLLAKEMNFRYVALHALAKIVHFNPAAVGNHQDTLISCMKDDDESIRKVALDVICALVDKQTVEAIVPDMVSLLLEVVKDETVSEAKTEWISQLTEKITTVVDKFSPTPLWNVDTLLRVFNAAGATVPVSEGHKLLGRITHASTETQTYTVKALWSTLAANAPVAANFTATKLKVEEDALNYCQKDSLLALAIWCTGEFADLLCRPPPTNFNPVVSVVDWKKVQPTASEVFDVLQSFAFTHYITNLSIKKAVLMALFKLAGRAQSLVEPVVQVCQRFNNHKDIELQQRSVEFCSLLPGLKSCTGLVDRMPPAPLSADPATSVGSDELTLPTTPAAEQDFEEFQAAPPPTTQPQTTTPTPTQPKEPDDFDLLFAGTGATQAAPTKAAPPPPKQQDAFDELFGPPQTTPQFGEFVAAPPPQQ